MENGHCELCRQAGGLLLWQDEDCRIVRVDDPAYPGFCRVIWNAHIKEMSDLPAPAQFKLWRIINAVEQVVRQNFQPDKVNLASFGNMVPHLHWHIIPRWRDDPHFPEPIWGKVQRDACAERPHVSDASLAAAVDVAIAAIFAGEQP